jgi:Tol biopolymer transport system component
MEPGAAVPGLYQSPGDGSSGNLLSGDVRDIAYDPSGQKVAFVREVARSGPPPPPADEAASEGEGEEAPPPVDSGTVTELFVAPVDDLSAAQQITDFGGTISSPTWSPNGIQLAFVSDYDGDEDIWTITDDGLNIRKLTENEAIDRNPAWSPTNDQILYVSDQNSPGLTKLFTMSPEGENPTQVLDLAGNTYHPNWSHTGHRIVFVNDAAGDGDVYVAEPDGAGSLLLTADDGGAEDLHPVFTPDGKWVGFASNRGGDTFQLYVIDVTGNVLVQLTDSELDKQELDFAPE